MIRIGVPCLSGYEGADQSGSVLETEAERIGFPVMIKAAFGGGGRGMRLAMFADGFLDALHLARAEAKSAFGSDNVILEKAVERPRHIEIQVLADRQGNVVHLGERDCSVQRRHQKVIEEAPCPGISQEMRAKLATAAVNGAKSIGYEGVGTVEFLLDENGSFYFLEMNTRLQVEHPVTEMVTGLDLVALQLSVAAGEPLPFAQDDVSVTGHAIEVRLYAEDPANEFLPTTGNIRVWQPASGADIRIDSGIGTGQEISPLYDPMLAKVIAYGATRDKAREKLIGALAETVLFGPANNRDFLIDVLGRKTFADGQATTAFIAEEYGDTISTYFRPAFSEIALAAVMLYEALQQIAERTAAAFAPELRGWSSAGILRCRFTLLEGDLAHDLKLVQARDQSTGISDGIDSVTVTNDGGVVRIDGQRVDLRAVHYDGTRVYISTGTRSYSFGHRRASGETSDAAGTGSVVAPMHGTLLEVFVAAGDVVVPGKRLAILEAMKMQHELLAEVSGSVSRVQATVETQVQAGDLLIEIEVDTAR